MLSKGWYFRDVEVRHTIDKCINFNFKGDIFINAKKFKFMTLEYLSEGVFRK